MNTSEYLLRVNNLKIHFPVKRGLFRRKKGILYAVDGISFKVKKGQTLGIVGESGCGKTTLARAIAGLYKPTSGKIIFDNKNLFSAKGSDLKSLRRNLQMIFQDPFESLNPGHTIRQILEEPFIIHKQGSYKKREQKVKKLLNIVGIPESSLNKFPHEFSGGQRQRIGIARAISLNPKMIICDEPVSALDVSVRAQIINLLLKLQKEMGLTYLFIAHDLAIVRHVSDNIGVMYLGKIVEYADSDSLYNNPGHPYTMALISAVPDPIKRRKRLILKGEVPSPINPPKGCSFNTRCPVAVKKCFILDPKLVEVRKGSDPRVLACHSPFI